MRFLQTTHALIGSLKNNVSPLKHPILSEKSEISRVINGQTSYNDKKLIKPSKRNKNSVKKKSNFLIHDMKNTTLKDLLPKMSTKRSKRRQPRGFSMEDGKFNHNSPTKYNFYPSRRISKLSSADFGSTSKRKYEDRSCEDANTIFSMRFQTHKGNFRKNKASCANPEMSPKTNFTNDFSFDKFEKVPSNKMPKMYGNAHGSTHSMMYNQPMSHQRFVRNKRTPLKLDETMSHKNDSQNPSSHKTKNIKMPMFLLRKKMKQAMKEEEVKKKYFKKSGDPDFSLGRLENHKDSIKLKSGYNLEILPQGNKVVSEATQHPSMSEYRGSFSASMDTSKMIADTGGLLLIKQQNKDFKSSFNHFMKIARENQSKLAESSIKIKRLNKNLHDIASLQSVPQKDIDFDDLKNLSIEHKCDIDFNDSHEMEDIQKDFRKISTKLNHQLEKIHHYSNNISAITQPKGQEEGEEMQELKLLIKKLNSDNSSYNRPKYIDSLRIKAENAKINNDQLRTEEEIILRMQDRDKKLQQAYKKYKLENIPEEEFLRHIAASDPTNPPKSPSKQKTTQETIKKRIFRGKHPRLKHKLPQSHNDVGQINISM
ncbi:unnamed protein product [Moneuplotes crassus]|uniref:Uncharacterized protein n=1 Tax=Euplotes crassus TaxID=5936 RepID=A0AAD1U0R3_EUPCR|nr:unnamed protein product [Moneuplotes crassus]